MTNGNKPGKIGVVFHAAAKHESTLLNNKILKGSGRLNTLIELLIRFQMGKYAFIADIKQMFHQIFVLEKEQKTLSFLWRDTILDKIQYYVMNVHLFGKIDSPWHWWNKWKTTLYGLPSTEISRWRINVGVASFCRCVRSCLWCSCNLILQLKSSHKVKCSFAISKSRIVAIKQKKIA